MLSGRQVGRGRYATVAVVVALVGALVMWLPGGAVAARFDATPEERTCSNTSPEVMLTFDDSGDEERTHAILDVLRDRHVRAGFFIVGSWARAHPQVMDRIRAEGHWVGNHTSNHPELATMSDAAIRSEIAAGVEGDLFRPPYASFNDRVRSIAASMGYRLCLWTVDTADYRSRSAADIQATVFRDLRPGGVILLHLHARNTLEALPGLIDGIRARGIELDDLVRYTAAAVDPATAGAVRVKSNGDVFTSDGDAFHGSAAAAGVSINDATAIAVPPGGGGYWIASRRGGIFSFGGVDFFGSAADLTLNRPVVGLVPTPTGRGYWLVASDGGVFAFGDAAFHGSTGNLELARPIVAMMSTPTGLGYWLVASDGGVFAFGDALFHGSLGGVALREPVVSAAATPAGDGYWLLARDGGVFTFGRAAFHGVPPETTTERPGSFLAIAGDGTGGYRIVAGTDGPAYAFG